MNGFSHNAMRVSLLASAAIVGLLAASPAMAQADAAAPAATNEGAVETVMVTAQRRSEKNVDVPIAITAVNAEQLKNAGITELAGIQKVAPAVRFDANGSYVQPSIRGVGSAVVSAGAGSNVGIYVDGFYSPNPLSANFDLLNVTGVQVLKGPQGTLFGHNTTGGAILVSTADPSYDRHGMIDASYGNYNAQSYKGYFTTGITNRIAVDVGGLLDKGDGFLKDIVTGSKTDGAYENWLIRAGVKVDVTDDISVLFRYTHSDTNDPTGDIGNAYVGSAPGLTGPLVPGAQWAGYSVFGQTASTAYATRPNEVINEGTTFRSKTDTYQLTLKAALGFADLTSYTQYSETHARMDNYDISASTISVPAFHVDGAFLATPLYNDPDKFWTQELLLNSNSEGRLKWTAGVFYMDWTEPFYAAPALFGGLIPQPAENTSGESVSIAGYVDATYQVLDQLFLTAGVRYSHDEFQNTHIAQTGCGTTGHPACLPDPLPTLSSDKLAPRAVVRYQLNDNSNVYASWSRGFKSGFYNVLGVSTLADATVRPEKIDAFEVGYKYAGRGLTFDTAAYYYDYSNLQISGFQASAGATGSYNTNAASSRIYGLEAQVNYDLTDHLNVNAAASYNKAEYTSFPNAPYFPGQCTTAGSPAGFPPVCTTGLGAGAVLGFLSQGSENLKNSTMQRAPEFTANVGARYNVNLFQGDLALSGNLYYTSSYYFDVAKQFKQNGYELLSLRAEWTDPTDTYSIALYGNNVTDKSYRSLVTATSAGIVNAWAAPATYGAEVKIRF